jgi:4-hydroxybenzoate polyprenyltransferase
MVYIINDARDRHFDRQHPTKRNRPFASGEIDVVYAIPIISILGILLTYLFGTFNVAPIITLLFYFILNVLYSLWLKRVPVLEIGIVASGYSLRVLFGAQIFHLPPSSWLMISTFAGAFGVVAAKRRSELVDQLRPKMNQRHVLGDYTPIGLQSTVTLSFGTSFSSYSIWLFEYSAKPQLLSLTCEMLGLVIFTMLIISSDLGALEAPEDILKSRRIMPIFGVFILLNLIIMYI